MCRLPNNIIFIVFSLLAIFPYACKHEKEVLEESTFNGYPKEIGEIILSNCATAGCHNEKSKDAAAGLSLASWESMMQGGRNNAASIPYSPQKSLLFLFTNTFDDLGPSVPPIMPYGAAPLSRNQVLTIRNWLQNGAPSDRGNIPFSSNPRRKKIYVLNSLCDEVTVFDSQSALIMRYIDAGTTGNEGFPESIKVSQDGNKWYVLFASGEFVEFDANNDQKTRQLELGKGIWRSFELSHDSKFAFVTNWSGNSSYYGGDVAMIDLESMNRINTTYEASDSLYFPYGMAITTSSNWLLTSCYTGNFIYKINIQNPAEPEVYKVQLEASETVQFNSPLYRPRTIQLLPGDTTYVVVCEKSNEIRIMSLLSDQLLHVVPVGEFPQEIGVSTNKPYLFISCTEDKDLPSRGKGSIYVVDYRTYSIVAKIYAGYQPRGLAVDEDKGLVYVANRNADPTGADAPHHYTDCDGNNGYVTAIDIETLEMVKEFKTEVSVDPFAVAIRP